MKFWKIILTSFAVTLLLACAQAPQKEKTDAKEAEKAFEELEKEQEKSKD